MSIGTARHSVTDPLTDLGQEIVIIDRAVAIPVEVTEGLVEVLLLILRLLANGAQKIEEPGLAYLAAGWAR